MKNKSAHTFASIDLHDLDHVAGGTDPGTDAAALSCANSKRIGKIAGGSAGVVVFASDYGELLGERVGELINPDCRSLASSEGSNNPNDGSADAPVFDDGYVGP